MATACDATDPMDIEMVETDSDFNREVPVMENPYLVSIILSHLPFTQKVLLESVCKGWKCELYSLYKKQFAIGNAPTKLDTIDRCHDSSHIVTALDVVPKVKLTNPAVLRKILTKCPNLKAIAITDNGEATYREPVPPPPVSPHPSQFDPDHIFANMQENLRGRHFNVMEMEVPHHLLRLNPVDLQLAHRNIHSSFPRRNNLRPLVRPNDIDVPRVHTPIDKWPSILSAAGCKIECLDLTGLQLPGPHTDFEANHGWKEFTNSSSAKYLIHLKCSFLEENDLFRILKRCPIREISAVRPAPGTSLSHAPSSLEKVALRSVVEPGIKALASAPHNTPLLREIFLCNVTPASVELIVRHFKQLTHVNLSFSAPINNPASLSRLQHLTKLQHLYLKFKPGFLTPGVSDTAFVSVFSSCSKLQVLKLVNCPLKDDTFKFLNLCPDLKALDFRVCPNHVLSDVTLTTLASLSKLKSCFISCLNTFSETSLIEMLIESRAIQSLKLHGCRELIPDGNIFFASLKRAKMIGNRQLTIEIQIEEEMAIAIAKCAHIPSNLHFSIRTRNDFYTTKNAQPSFLPTGECVDGDFDAEITNQGLEL